jgi:hypothetical protein
MHSVPSYSMLMTPEDAALNSEGKLTQFQLKKIRRRGIVQLIAGICFLILVPTSILTVQVQWGVLTIVWLVVGLLFAGIFLWTAKGYLLMKMDGHTIHRISGPVRLKNSGSRHVLVTINDRSFLLMKNESAALRENEEYTLYFLEDPRMVIGWTAKAAA